MSLQNPILHVFMPRPACSRSDEPAGEHPARSHARNCMYVVVSFLTDSAAVHVHHMMHADFIMSEDQAERMGRRGWNHIAWIFMKRYSRVLHG